MTARNHAPLRSVGFWTAWSLLALVASASIYVAAASGGRPVPVSNALIRGFWWIYADAGLLAAGYLLLRWMQRRWRSVDATQLLVVGYAAVAAMILAFRVVDLYVRGRNPDLFGWMTLVHHNLKFAAMVVATAAAVQVYYRLQTQREEMQAKAGELLLERQRHTQSLLDPSHIDERLDLIRDRVANDPDEANRLLVQFAAEMRSRLEQDDT